MEQDSEQHKSRESNQSLWMLTLSPTIWAVHFLASYITAAIWCAKVAGREGALGPARAAIGAYTVVALAGLGIVGWLGYRRHKLGTASPPHDFDTPEDRHRFLGYATVLLSALSAVATIYAALAAVFMGSCD